MRLRSTLKTALCSATLLSAIACNGKLEQSGVDEAPSPSQPTPGVPVIQQPSAPGQAPSLPSVPVFQPPSEETPATPSEPTPPVVTAPPPATPTPTPPPATPPPATPPPPVEPQYARILWVSPSGSDTASGTEKAPLRTVGRALSLVRPGEAVFLKTGTYSERLKLDAQGGSEDAWLTLRAAPGATPVIKGGSGGTTLVDVRGAYWRIEGLTLDVAGDASFAVMWRGEGAHHGELRGCTAKNGTAGAGINVAERAHDVLIEDNRISNFSRGSGDSHGVVVQTNSRNVVVRGNDIHHNSGDAVQCLGPEGGATEPGTPFDNLLVEDNRLHDNRENGADIKTCSHVTLRGNVVFGHRRSSTSAGEGVVVHLSARDVTLEDNEFYGNARAINIGGVREGPPPTRIVIRRNVVHDGLGASEGQEGTGIRVDTSSDVKVQHNTVWNMSGACLIFGHGDSGASQKLDVRNNVFAGCGVAARGGPGRAGAVVDGNLYSRSGGAAVFRLEGVDLDLADWRAEAGLDRRSQERAPGFVNVDTDDFRLGPSSPARDTGLSLGLPFCGEAPDEGAFESGCT